VEPLLQLQKRTMALAGVLMLAYLVFHMLTNLSFFTEAVFTNFYDWYNGGLIRWIVLITLVVAIFIHVKVAFRIRRKNAEARTIDYAQHDKFKIPAYLVTVSIIFLLAFIIIHIIQSLFLEQFSTYEKLTNLFQSTLMVLFYLAGLFVLTMHLQHSLANVLQTLGKTSVSCHVYVWLGTLVLTLGFALIPLFIYFGMS
jgi:succinate dehydrogenase cytochrome b subunit